MLDLFGEAPPNRTASWPLPPDTRGSINILSSCIITLGLCIWTAIHMNVPEHDPGPKHQMWDPRGWLAPKRWRKVGWLILGLLAPEMIAFTAWVQRRDAHQFTKQVNELLDRETSHELSNAATSSNDVEMGQINAGTAPKAIKTTQRCQWTHVHGFFAIQGGFTIDTSQLSNSERYLPGARERVTLSTEGILTLLRYEPMLLPDISKEAIEDKGKANGLEKAIICIQALWFIVQCIFRLATPGLAISLLELSTFAHAICALITYGLWWDKPLDIGEPITIIDPRVHNLCARLCDSSFDGTQRNFSSNLLYSRNNDDVKQCATRDRRRQKMASLCFLETGKHHFDMDCVCDRMPNFPIHFVFDVLGEIISGHDMFSESPAIVSEHFTRTGVGCILGFTVAGALYGGLHLFAWCAPFTSHTEKLLWRISAIAVAASGPGLCIGLVLPCIGLLSYRSIRLRIERSEFACFRGFITCLVVFAFLVGFLFFWVGPIFYVFARAYLVIECFISFAYLPDSAFKEPRWNSYFIHIQ